MVDRRERVILELVDHFTAPTARAAAAVALLDKNLDHLSGQAVETQKTNRNLDRELGSLGKTSSRTEKDIDKLSGRLRILGDLLAVVGPSAIPIGAVAVPAVTGLAAQLGFAAIAAGTAVLAFQGVGTALEAVNKAALAPTTANLEDARDAMEALAPEAQAFVDQLRSMAPELQRLRDAAAGGLFPGLGRGLEGLESALPRVERLISSVATELGDIAGDAGQSLGSDRWAPFLDFLSEEAPSALGELADAIGNTAHGLAEMWMAFDPVNDDFSSWLVRVTADFDRWAGSLSQTDGFQEFVDYIRTNGPRVAETAGAIGNALLQIAQAVAPLGGPSLQIIESLADALATIADSGAGTAIFGIVGALAAMNTAMRISAALNKATFGGPVIAAIRAQDSALGGLSNSFRGAAKSAGLLGAAYVAIDAGGDILDSFKRQGAAGDGVARTYEQLAEKIERSNVGKFAGDFNIDVQRLAEDMGKFGDQGEYYQNVVARLAETNDGFGGKIKMGRDFLNPFISGTEKAGLAAYDLTTIVEKAAGANEDLSGRLAWLGSEAVAARHSLDDLNETMRANAEAALGAFDAETQYRQALKAAAAQGRKNNAGIKGSSEAALNNRSAISGLAAAWNNQSEAVKNNKARFREARKSFIDTAVAMGVPIAQARRLAQRLLEIPRSRDVKVTADTSAALSRIRVIQAEIDRLRGKTLTISVVRQMQGMEKQKDVVDSRSADGGSVPKTGLPYADRHHYLLADGEEVISNRRGQADRYRPLLKAINNAADGATVGPGFRSYVRNDLDMKFPSTLAQWNRALAASTKVVEREKSQRQALLEQAQGVRDSIKSGYRSDLFGEQSRSSVWMSDADRAKAGTGDVFSTLTGDIGNLGALKTAIAQLKSKGLDGAALADLLSNGSLQQVQAFAGSSRSEVTKYENLYNQRERDLSVTGNAGASASFGPQIKAQTAELKRVAYYGRQLNIKFATLEKELRSHPRRNGQEVGRVINSAAPKRRP